MKGKGYEAILCTLNDKIDDTLLDAAGDSVKVISTMSVGFDHVSLSSPSNLWTDESSISWQTNEPIHRRCNELLTVLPYPPLPPLLSLPTPAALCPAPPFKVNRDAIISRGLKLGNTPEVLTETTAELCLTLLLATARRIPEAVNAVKNAEWGSWVPL